MKGVPGTEYISFTDSHGYREYQITKRINGKNCFLGHATTLIQALMKRDWCKANNWQKYPNPKKGMQTKFGRVILKEGYYIVISSNEGNYNRALHKLIFEDFYGTKIPKGYVIHHKNGIKTDNCILNLQLLSDVDHKKLHAAGENNSFYGKKHSKESLIKISDTKSSTGYFRVHKSKNKQCKQGFMWVYVYTENRTKKQIASTNLEVLKQKVLDKGLDWVIVDKEKAKACGLV